MCILVPCQRSPGVCPSVALACLRTATDVSAGGVEHASCTARARTAVSHARRVPVRRWLCWHCSLWLLRHALTHARAGLHARACRRIRARLRMRTCGHTPTPAGEAPGPRAPRSRRCCPTRDPIAPPTLAMVRTCTGFPAAERRQQHARRQGKARRLTQVPWAESRRPLAQPAALPPRMGPERPILAMTVKVFFQEEEEEEEEGAPPPLLSAHASRMRDKSPICS